MKFNINFIFANREDGIRFIIAISSECYGAWVDNYHPAPLLIFPHMSVAITKYFNIFFFEKSISNVRRMRREEVSKGCGNQ